MRICVLSVLVLALLANISAPATAALISDTYGGRDAVGGAPDYEWWYGCSPTAVGMIMGHYDRKGYSGTRYDDLVPGGRAERSTFDNPDARVNQIIASPGHIHDFYSEGFGMIRDDVAPEQWHDFDCLADFMGTSQDAAWVFGNSNGSSRFFYLPTGSQTSKDSLQGNSFDYTDYSAMYGIQEYVEYRDYNVATLFNQLSDAFFDREGPIGGYPILDGFTFDEYKAEIDAGRPVLIHVEGHSMMGYGYDKRKNEILVRDTWTEGDRHTMAWDGLYDNSRGLVGVTVLELAAGKGGGGKPGGKGGAAIEDGYFRLMADFERVAVVPEPSTYVLLISAAVSLAMFRRWRRSHSAL